MASHGQDCVESVDIRIDNYQHPDPMTDIGTGVLDLYTAVH